jgi:hypothetical protein
VSRVSGDQCIRYVFAAGRKHETRSTKSETNPNDRNPKHRQPRRRLDRAFPDRRIQRRSSITDWALPCAAAIMAVVIIVVVVAAPVIAATTAAVVAVVVGTVPVGGPGAQCSVRSDYRRLGWQPVTPTTRTNPVGQAACAAPERVVSGS